VVSPDGALRAPLEAAYVDDGITVQSGEFDGLPTSECKGALGRQHLFDRVAERDIRAEDLYKLKLWRESEPEAPEDPWYKDFGSFKICGEGELPETFLLKGQAAKGRSL
jgi:hypothetical protein